MMSHDITMTIWLLEERHLIKYVRHRTFQWVLVLRFKILYVITVYYYSSFELLQRS